MAEISVIVPVYNTEKYLPCCIDSILAQTFTDFELILVNDGSTDNSGMICDEYAKKDSRVLVIHQENQGVSVARNNGISLATGMYLMFCDSDDWAEAQWCEILYKEIVKSPKSWVISNFWNVSENFDKIIHIDKEFDDCQSDYYSIYKIGLTAYLWDKIYIAEVLNKYNIRFNKDITIGEDVGFNVRYYKQCTSIKYIHKPLYNYVYREGSAVNRYDPDLFEHLLYPFYVRIDLIDEKFLAEYCDSWLYVFINALESTLDKRNKISLTRKLSVNKKMINTVEFKFCLSHASCKNENPLFIKLLKRGNYYIYYLLELFVQLKHSIFK